MKKKLKRIVLMLSMLLVMTVMLGATASAAKPKLSASKKTLYVGGDKAKSQFVLTLKNTKKPVSWKTSNKKVVRFIGKGNVITATGLKKGTATITAKQGKKTYKCKVTVRQYVTSLKLNKTSVSLKKGKTYQLKATVKPSNANTKTVTWSSSNKKVATVSSKGKIKAKGNGTATITCKAKDGSGKKVTCKVTVGTVSTSKPLTAEEQFLKKMEEAVAKENAKYRSRVNGDVCNLVYGIPYRATPTAIVYTWDAGSYYEECDYFGSGCKSNASFRCWADLYGDEMNVGDYLTWTIDRPDFIEMRWDLPCDEGAFFRIRALKGEGFAYITYNYRGKIFKTQVWVTSLHDTDSNGNPCKPSKAKLEAEYKRLTGMNLYLN